VIKKIEIRSPDSFTHHQVEAALIVWEWINVWTTSPSEPASNPEWVELREAFGSMELRAQSVVLGTWCLEIYDLCTAKDELFFDAAAYDWEVIPMILSHARNEAGQIVIYKEGLPDPKDIAPKVMEEYLYGQWLGECKQEAERQWAYADLPMDHEVLTKAAYKHGDKPADYIKWLGEKHDLTPKEPMWMHEVAA